MKSTTQNKLYQPKAGNFHNKSFTGSKHPVYSHASKPTLKIYKKAHNRHL